jgi:putative peptide zinc metalloprotease protein
VAGADRADPQDSLRAGPDVEVSAADNWKDFDRGGGSNIVQLVNTQDGRFRARGNAELDRIRGDDVRPVNVAEARASCTDCQTIAAALQVAIYQRGADVIVPINKATAVNENCTRCVTVARAMQYVIPVDDLRSVPRDVDRLVKRINKEADYFEHIKDLDRVDPNEAQGRLNQLEADFASLEQFLNDVIDQKGEGGPSPSPAVSPMPSPSAVAR